MFYYFFLLSLLKCQLHDFLLLSHSILPLHFFGTSKSQKKILKILLHHKVFCHFRIFLQQFVITIFSSIISLTLSSLSTKLITKVPIFYMKIVMQIAITLSLSSSLHDLCVFQNRLELVSSIGLNNNICLSSSQNDINGMNGLGIPVVAPTHQTSPLSVQQLPPIGSHRKTLERNIRNNHHNQMPNGIIESTKTMIDGNIIASILVLLTFKTIFFLSPSFDTTTVLLGDLGIPIVRTASIRRQGMRGSNNSINNGSPRFIRNHQRHQRSPMPTRVSKRRGDLEQSTASLNSVNSIEV